MSTDFPTSIDPLTPAVAPTDPRNNPSLAGKINDLDDTVVALQTKVGVNSSAVTTSLDYRSTNVSGLLTASGVPSAGTGVNGNLYLNTATGIIYRKAAGSWSAIYTPASGGASQILQVTATGAGTYTVPVGAITILIEALGGGGGGGSGDSRNGTNGAGGGGGSGGGLTILQVNAASLGSSIGYSVGAGGTGGIAATTGNNGVIGNSGGDTTVTGLLVARGGKGGLAQAAAAIGGAGGTSNGMPGAQAANQAAGIAPAPGTGFSQGGGGGGGSGGGLNSGSPFSGGPGFSVSGGTDGVGGNTTGPTAPTSGTAPVALAPGPGPGGGWSGGAGTKTGANALANSGSGGGGGGVGNFVASGAGGNGGSGYLIFTAIF